VRECALQPDAIELLTRLMRFFRPGTVAGRLLDALEVLDPADDATIEFLVDRLVTCRDAAIARDLFYQCARLRRVETFRRVFAAHPSPALANRALRVAAASGDIDFVRAMLSFASIRQDIGIDRCLALRDAVQSNHAHVVAALLAVDELVSECVLRALQFGFQRNRRRCRCAVSSCSSTTRASIRSAPSTSRSPSRQSTRCTRWHAYTATRCQS
jgi:hypothetical protein